MTIFGPKSVEGVEQVSEQIRNSLQPFKGQRFSTDIHVSSNDGENVRLTIELNSCGDASQPSEVDKISQSVVKVVENVFSKN